MYFVFNKDGRVVQIESSTNKVGAGHGIGVTSKTVTLGDSMSKVYAHYGWGKMLRGAPTPVLDYTRDYHVGFFFDHSNHGPVVTGITVTLLDIPAGAGSTSTLASSPGGMGGGMMGMAGPGMMGRPGAPMGGGMMSMGGTAGMVGRMGRPGMLGPGASGGRRGKLGAMGGGG